MKNRKFISIILYVALLSLIFSWLLGAFGIGGADITYSEMVQQLNAGNVKSFLIHDNQIHLELHTPLGGKDEVSAPMADADAFRREMWEVIQARTEDGTLESYDFYAEKVYTPYSWIMPLLLVGLAVVLVYVILMSRATANNAMSNFGKARTVLGVPDNRKVTFADVAGADEEKAEFRKWWIFCGTPPSTPPLVPGSPMVCCWLALPAPVRPSLPGR